MAGKPKKQSRLRGVESLDFSPRKSASTAPSSPRFRLQPYQTAIPYCPTDDDCIMVITDRILQNTWETRITAQQLAAAWNTTEGHVNVLFSRAVAGMKAMVNPVTIALLHQEMLILLAGVANEARANGDDREAIIAAKAVLDETGAHLRGKEFGRDTKQSGKDAYQALRDAGWKPPNTLPGLPAPNITDPSLLGCAKDIVSESSAVNDGPGDEHEDKDDGNNDL